MVVVDDLYRPFRPKRRTRAMIAREKGLEGLANVILLQMTKEPLEKRGGELYFRGKGVASAAEALAGAKDILAESISDEADYRMHIRKADVSEGHADFCSERPRAAVGLRNVLYL